MYCFNNIKMDLTLIKMIESLDLKENEKYLSMIFYNKLVINYLYSCKKEACYKDMFITKSIKNVSSSVFGDIKTVYTCINELERKGLIARGTSYIVGEYSKGFKPLVIPTGKFITVHAKDYLNKRQIENLRKRLIKKIDKGVEWHLLNLIKNVELDYNRLRKLVKTNYNVDLVGDDKQSIIDQVMELGTDESFIREHLKELGYKRIRKDRIEQEIHKRTFLKMKILELLEIEKTGIVKGEKGGRHFHTLSNAPRELRYCVVSKDTKRPHLMQVDIKNSQPFFLLCLFFQHGIRVERGLELGIIGGKFYEEIGNCWGYNPYSVSNNHDIRQEVKRKVYSNILFADEHVRATSEYFQKVKDRYPLFAKAIESLTETGATLASLLQRLEADEVLPIVKKFHGIGLHDAVITIAVDEVESTEKVVHEIIKRFKEKFNLTPSLSIDKISERSDIEK
jgi:uncharacterized protein YpuA (DUF1002 family)